jgi:hypothetical protein
LEVCVRRPRCAPLHLHGAGIRKRNTRPAYAQAVREFLAWCWAHRVPSITAVQPMHVAGYIEEMTRARWALTAKQRLERPSARQREAWTPRRFA